MTALNRSIPEIWHQTNIPVVYRHGGGKALMVRLPYAPDNRDWLREGHRKRPEWDAAKKYWRLPASWFDDIITRALHRFGRIYVIQPYRIQEKCAPACWNAKGFVCECSCMGNNHGSQHPAGSWRVISETFAVQWNGRELGCRLIERVTIPGESA